MSLVWACVMNVGLLSIYYNAWPWCHSTYHPITIQENGDLTDPLVLLTDQHSPVACDVTGGGDT